MSQNAALPLEDFIQAITSQLDRTQMSMALKAKAGLPLTFAVKDLRLDLRAHLEMAGGAVTIRPAGPGDSDASTLHLELTTITRPMIEENTRDISVGEGDPTIRDVLGDDLTEEDERRLEWVGIQDLAQYRELQRGGGERLMHKVAQRPIDKLRFALEQASRPHLDAIEALPSGSDTGSDQPIGPPRLALRGRNLLGNVGRPTVRIAGEIVPLLETEPDRLVVQPLAVHTSATVEIETDEGMDRLAFVDQTGSSGQDSEPDPAPSQADDGQEAR